MWVGRVRAALIGPAAVCMLLLSAAGQSASAADGWLREELQRTFEVGRLDTLLGDTTIEEADAALAETAARIAGEGPSHDRMFDLLAQHRIEMARWLAQIEWRVYKDATWPDDGMSPDDHAREARTALEDIRKEDSRLRFEDEDLLPPAMAAEALYHLTDGVLDFPPEQSVFAGRDEKVDAIIAGLPRGEAAAGGKTAGQQVAAAAPKSAKKRAAETGEDPVAVLAVIIGAMVNGRADADTSPCDGFAGMWQSDAGPLLLDADGFGVYDGGASILDGTVKGSKLTGTFTQVDTTGEISATLARDGRSFTGTWSSGAAGGPFNGTCVAGAGDPAVVQGQVAQAAGVAVADAAFRAAEEVLRLLGGADQPAVDQAAGQAADQPVGDPPCGGFAGRWETNYGVLQMSEDGGVINGNYGDGAELRGKLDGRSLSGTIKEPNWGEGKFSFTLSDDGWTFTGHWTDADGGGGAPWDGRCVPPAAG